MATATTDQEYYENKEHWGEGQFVTLKSIIDNIIVTSNDDSYFKHTNRFSASIFGKQGIKDLHVDIKADDKAIAIQLAPSRIFPFPRYMTNWSRISVKNKCGKLNVLNINNNPVVQDYLQDHEWKLLYDDSGKILRGADYNAQKGDCCLEIQSCEENTTDDCSGEKFKDSWVKQNKEGNYFEFSDDLVDEIIIIEFQTAGLDSIDDCDINVHNFMENTLTRFIQWNILMGRRNTPISTVEYYHELFKKAKKKSKKMMGKKISVDQILKSIDLRYS